MKKNLILEPEVTSEDVVYELGEGCFDEDNEIGSYVGSEDVPFEIPSDEADSWRCNRKTKEWKKNSDQF